MAKKLYLCFLWHMHQPYYKNPETGKFEMPWVFLHALKSYYDMPWLASTYGIKSTFNLVPSLIVQLQEYKDSSKCQFLTLWEKEPSSLNLDEKRYLLRFLFSSNVENMIKPLDRYYQLFLKKHRVKEEDLVKVFDDQEFLDLEVLFILSWCGNYLRQNSKIVRELIEKGRYFSQEEKINLLKELLNFVSSLLDIYKNLMYDRSIEISTTPFYHPIIPILLDPQSAKESKPDIQLPKIRHKFDDFALEHLQSAVSLYKDIFKKNPSGVWPSEGSISNKTLELFSDTGFLWTASDEEVLFNSISKRDISYIYEVWKFGSLNIFFRDRYLSDSIGFRYYHLDPQDAVNEFMQRLFDIYQKSQKSPVVSIILDGENPWEHYKNSGYDFLTLLYEKIKQTDWIEVSTFSSVLEEDIKFSNLDKIVAGSWIYGNLTTWIGHPEKNTAWEYLDRAVGVYRLNPNKKAHNHIMIAQASDWFWWYGDDHYSSFSDMFDILFRLNIKKVYSYCGLQQPSYLDRPIKSKIKSQYISEPVSYITPNIDGKITNYFEWLYAGEFDIKFDVGSMSASVSIFERVLYGFDKDNIYLYIEGKFKTGDKIIMDIISEREVKLIFDLKKGLNSIKLDEYEIKYSFEKGLEISIPISLIDGDGEIEFNLSYFSGNIVMERVPVYSNFHIAIENFEYNWYV